MIEYVNYKPKYFDKNRKEITPGCKIKFPNGRIEKVYLTDQDELGIDATNPRWIDAGKAFECEYGIYPLNETDTNEVEVIE